MPELRPRVISWRRTGRIMVFLDEVRLPRRLMGRLPPEDWQPLIASSIIYNGLVARRHFDNYRGGINGLAIRRMLFPFAIADFALVGVILTLFRARILYSSIVLSLTLVAYVFFAALMFRNYFLSPLRKLRLEADRQTAEHFGKERLLQIFRKISDMRLGFQTGPRFLSDLTTPRIKERIRSLEGISNSVQPKENGMT